MRLVDEDRELLARRLARELRGEPLDAVRDLERLARVAVGGWPHPFDRIQSARAALAADLSELELLPETAGPYEPAVVLRACELWRDARRDRPTFRRPLQVEPRTGDLISKGRPLGIDGRRLPLPQAI